MSTYPNMEKFLIDPRIEGINNYMSVEVEEDKESAKNPKEIGAKYKDLLGKIRVVFIDIEGTIFDACEQTAIPKTIRSIKKLRKAGFKILFVTNTIKGSKNDLCQSMHSMGFDMNLDEIFTSVCACRIYLDKNKLRPYLLVDKSVTIHFDGLNTENPNSVVVGLPSTQFDYVLLNKAYTLLMNGRPLITYHSGEKEETDIKGVHRMGPGPFIQCLEFVTDSKQILIAKPSAEFFTFAMEKSGFKPEECVMIGDQIIEDVAGAANVGMVGILVQTGEYQPSDEEKFKPTLMVKNFNVAAYYLLCAAAANRDEVYVEPESEEEVMQVSERSWAPANNLRRQLAAYTK